MVFASQLKIFGKRENSSNAEVYEGNNVSDFVLQKV
jgi:hypothetical protein